MDYNMEMNQERRRNVYACGNYMCVAHVIRPGDTLYRLSREYGVKVSALMMANPFVDIYNLRIGDELCIPRLRRPEDMPRAMPEPDTDRMPEPAERMSWERDTESMPGQMTDKNQETAMHMSAQTGTPDSERVVDAEMNMMQDKSGYMEPECPKCNGIKYQKGDDTY